MNEFTLETIESTNELVEAVFEWIYDVIPGAGIVDLVTAEGFFMLSEAIPRVIGIGRSSDSPEIEFLQAEAMSVDHFLDGDNRAGGVFFIIIVSRSVDSIANAVMVMD